MVGGTTSSGPCRAARAAWLVAQRAPSGRRSNSAITGVAALGRSVNSALLLYQASPGSRGRRRVKQSGIHQPGVRLPAREQRDTASYPASSQEPKRRAGCCGRRIVAGQHVIAAGRAADVLGAPAADAGQATGAHRPVISASRSAPGPAPGCRCRRWGDGGPSRADPGRAAGGSATATVRCPGSRTGSRSGHGGTEARASRLSGECHVQDSCWQRRRDHASNRSEARGRHPPERQRQQFAGITAATGKTVKIHVEASIVRTAASATARARRGQSARRRRSSAISFGVLAAGSWRT